MTTTFETQVKISFELSVSELQDLHGALNSAEVAITEKRNDEKRSHADRKYFEGVCKTLEGFVANFNPANIIND